MRRLFDRRGQGASSRMRQARESASARRRSGLARYVQYVLFMCALYLPLLAAGSALADDRVLLQELMPELSGTPLGAVDVAPAPPPGESLTIRRGDVLRALARAGVGSNGLNIPRTARVTREVANLTNEAFAELAHDAVTEATAPCELRDARYPNEVRLASGPRTFHAEFSNGLRNGSSTGSVVVESGGRSVRVPVVVRLSCPPTEVSAGAQVTAVAVVGHVRASAPAEARQPGRTGEIIRIINRATGANLRARVVDAHTVEVVQ
jgi:Chaperone for flagella basal body P-ring formation